MSKIVPILLITGFLGVLSGCATQPEPVQSNQQAQIAKAIAKAEAERRAALEAARVAEEALARTQEENNRMKKKFRMGLNK